LNARQKIVYLLVKNGKISHKEAKLALQSGRVLLNENVCFENVLVGYYDSLYLDQQCLLNGNRFLYYKFYKPIGIECTLQSKISHSLFNYLGPEYADLFYVGRLDKQSEGLLIMSNDGQIYNKVISPTHQIGKRYWVQLEKKINADFKEKMENGVAILGTLTLPCTVEILDDFSFEIILTQGLNRQIRRMCFALGNYVTQLKRLSIGQIGLDNMNSGEIQVLDQTEINWLRNLT
jgi:23S rRNA pseudouridine2604 synthase